MAEFLLSVDKEQSSPWLGDVLRHILQSVVLFPLLIVMATCVPSRFIHSSPSTGQLLAGGSSTNCAEISRESCRSNAALRKHIL